MTVYYPEITVVTQLHAFSDNANVSTQSYQIEVDAPSFDGLLSDLRDICKEIVAAHVQRFIDDNVEELPLHVDVGYSIMSLTKSITHTIKKNEFDTLRKSTLEPDKPQLNSASLQNDIMYGANILESIPEVSTNIQLIGALNWQWHILNKHFGLHIPQKIQDLATNFGKDSQ